MRRDVVQKLGAGTLGAVASLGRVLPVTTESVSAHVPDVASQNRARPNIILMLLDDKRFDDLAAMPAVQSLLVDRGTSFTNFMVTTPSCAPARASILRGQYLHNHGVMRSQGEFGGFGRFHTLGHEKSTVATWLQEAGYTTALIGKYLDHYPYDEDFPASVTATYQPPGWSEWAGVTNEGYNSIVINENGELNAYRGKRHYSTDVFANKAVEFITQAVSTTRPFFLCLTPRAPHGPAKPAARHASAFARTSAPRPPSFNEPDVSDKPAWVRALPSLSDNDAAQIDDYYLDRLRTLLAVDEMVTTLIETLSKAGTLDSTFILFTSDSGYHLGEHRASQEKGSPYEESILAPLVVRGPGVPEGKIAAALASQADLAPTFAAWAGVEAPDFVDGRSLGPLLNGGPAPRTWRETVLVELFTDRPQDSTGNTGFQALRTEELIYVEYLTGERELYDLVQDPYQIDNLASEANPSLVRALSKRLARMTACTADSCRAIEAVPLP